MKTIYAPGTVQNLVERLHEQDPSLIMIAYAFTGLALFYVTARVVRWSIN